MEQYTVAIVGATGLVGETLLALLEERNFPVEKIIPIASENSAGDTVGFKGKRFGVKTLDEVDFSEVDFAFFSAGAAVSKEWAREAANAGAIVIDNTTAFRMDPEIPLVVPEVNAHALAHYAKHNIIANPNCSTIQMVVALKPLHDKAKIRRINVCTYQAVAGTGRQAVEELAQQTAQMLNGQPFECNVYPTQIAFNCLPHIDDFEENGYTKEEMKMVRETQKILEDETIAVNPTAVRVGIFYGHSEAVHIETETKLTAKEARALLEAAPGVKVIDKLEPCGYPTPVSHATGQDEVCVGRIREDISHPNGLDMWVVADNIRKGAALNSVQIAEHLIKNYL